MGKCNLASIDSIETAGMLDGPGIRTIIFFNGCNLRCKYCHNPETWKMGEPKYTVLEIYEKIIRNKSYFKNGGGVTFSGGDPLLHSDYIIELSKMLKKENIHLTLDTAGVGCNNPDKLLELMDLVIMDVKHVNSFCYKELTGMDIKYSLEFFDKLKNNNSKLWIRQVIIPNYNDNKKYIDEFYDFIKDIPNVEKIEFLPYHSYGENKYVELGINYPYKDLEDMDYDKCNELFEYFQSKKNK